MTGINLLRKFHHKHLKGSFKVKKKKKKSYINTLESYLCPVKFITTVLNFCLNVLHITEVHVNWDHRQMTYGHLWIQMNQSLQAFPETQRHYVLCCMCSSKGIRQEDMRWDMSHCPHLSLMFAALHLCTWSSRVTFITSKTSAAQFAHVYNICCNGVCPEAVYYLLTNFSFFPIHLRV